MKKLHGAGLLLILLVLSLTGCGQIGAKAANASAVYCATTILSALMLAAYLWLIQKKNIWFGLLFSAVFVVNIGYLTLSLSGTLENALLANRIAYLGSVFLPVSMLMMILDSCKIRYPRSMVWLLLTAGTAMFFIAASPGYLDIYYKEVSLSTVNGMTVLEKVYGSWHRLYLFYLLAYFAATVWVLIRAAAAGSMDSAIYAVFMGAAVFINMGVWLLEQLVRIDFELLSVSYIISELFILMLCLMLQEKKPESGEDAAEPPVDAPMQECRRDEAFCPEASEPAADAEERISSGADDERLEYFAAQRLKLTPTEKIIYNLYLEGKSTKEVMAELNIKENTLKFHNKNIYGKLGVSSRKELLETARRLEE